VDGEQSAAMAGAGRGRAAVNNPRRGAWWVVLARHRFGIGQRREGEEKVGVVRI
jgi:hypothetical protein